MKSLNFLKPTLAITLAIVFAGLLSVRPAQAGYTVTLQQVGPDVVATGSGAINLAGLIYNNSGLRNPGIIGGGVFAYIYTGSTSSSVDSYYEPIPTGPTSFGDGNWERSSSSGSGDMVGIAASGPYGAVLVTVPTGYVSGTVLSDSATYSGQTFATLGVTPGTYKWSWGSGANQNFTLQITGVTNPPPTPVPTITISVSPAQVNEGADATFTVSASTVNPSQPITVGHSMGGIAKEGTDYTLSGSTGQFTIPPGQSSATVTLHALVDMVKEKHEKAQMKLSPGAGYILGKPNKATVTIN